jgi:hypothetical protein
LLASVLLGGIVVAFATWQPARDLLRSGKEALWNGVSVVTGQAAADRGRMTAQMLLRRRLEQALREYRSVHGSDPERLQDLVDEGLLQSEDLIDPWGGHLAVERSGRKLRIHSAGPDGRVQTKDDWNIDV